MVRMRSDVYADDFVSIMYSSGVLIWGEGAERSYQAYVLQKILGWSINLGTELASLVPRFAGTSTSKLKIILERVKKY